MPFTFMQAEHLRALGIAQPDVAGEPPALSREHLAAWEPPANATDGYVLEVTDAPPAQLRRNRSGTRIDELAAEHLWSARAELEPDGAITAHAWCTRCGRHHLDARVSRGHLVQRIKRWCPDCGGSEKRHLKQRRCCAADDCDRWFEPTRGDRIYCSNACRSAAGTAVPHRL